MSFFVLDVFQATVQTMRVAQPESVQVSFLQPRWVRLVPVPKEIIEPDVWGIHWYGS
jgi:hypothetical protein